MQALLKTFLAATIVVGLTPLADAHTCEPNEYSIDPSHRVGYCNQFFCILVPHTCVPRIAHDLAAPEESLHASVLP